jgi:hypothetical protein
MVYQVRELLQDGKSLEEVFNLLRENLKKEGKRKCHIAGIRPPFCLQLSHESLR